MGGAALLLTLLLCFTAIYYWEYVRELGNYGYPGVFIISIFAGATIAVPVPALFVVFTLGGVLNPAIVGATSGLGEAVGGMAVYITGYGGGRAFQKIKHPLFSRMVDWVQRRGSLAVFIMSAIFNPFFYPLTMAAGLTRLGLWKFFLTCWGGKTVKGMVVAYAGYFGLRSLLRLLGAGI